MSGEVYRPKRESGDEFQTWLARDCVRVLDGATGTELERLGVPTPMPLWSAAALESHPDVIRQIHSSYLDAGADVLTANTFRTQQRALARAGWGERAAALTARAIELAQQAASAHPHPARVFGSAPPLEDCYRPDRVPDDSALVREHANHAQNLAAAGITGVWVETMNTVREACAATRAVVDAGMLPFVCFVCNESGKLLSGESLALAAEAVVDLGAEVVGVNCLPPRAVQPCLDALDHTNVPLAVYANLGEPCDSNGFTRSDDCTPDAFFDHARRWSACGVRWIGGCCGTTPAHIRAIAAGFATSAGRFAS